jgi:hypothetical protein
MAQHPERRGRRLFNVSDGLPRRVIVSGSPLRSISSSSAMHFALNSVMPTVLPMRASN